MRSHLYWRLLRRAASLLNGVVNNSAPGDEPRGKFYAPSSTTSFRLDEWTSP